MPLDETHGLKGGFSLQKKKHIKIWNSKSTSIWKCMSENKTIAIFNMSIKNLEKNANEDLKNEWNQEIQNENDLVINLNSEENIRNSRNSEQEIREDPKSLITEDRKNLDLDAKGGSQRIQILTWTRL